jgi:hypothetical protein
MMARIPALIGSGKLGQALITNANSESIGAARVKTAPDSAPLMVEPLEFPVFPGGGSNPVPPTFISASFIRGECMMLNQPRKVLI